MSVLREIEILLVIRCEVQIFRRAEFARKRRIVVAFLVDVEVHPLLEYASTTLKLFSLQNCSGWS